MDQKLAEKTHDLQFRHNDEYELFISYAHNDNIPKDGDDQGWVDALQDAIIAEHRRYSTEPLRIFYDKHEIHSMDDWELRIEKGLRQSHILLVCLSPNYFRSAYCKREWEEYTKRRITSQMGHDIVATVYFVEVPGNNPDLQTDEIREWLNAVQKGQYTDLQPWYDKGVRALQDQVVQARLSDLGNSVWERIQRARRAKVVPGNIRRLNPHFVGRRAEIRELHESLTSKTIGVVTAVHGLGGMGKTEWVHPLKAESFSEQILCSTN